MTCSLFGDIFYAYITRKRKILSIYMNLKYIDSSLSVRPFHGHYSIKPSWKYDKFERRIKAIKSYVVHDEKIRGLSPLSQLRRFYKEAQGFSSLTSLLLIQSSRMSKTLSALSYQQLLLHSEFYIK